MPNFKILLLTFLIGQTFAFSALALVINKGKEVPAQSRTNTKEPASKRNGSHLFEIGIDSFSRSLLKTTSTESGKKDFSSPFQFPLLLSYAFQFSAEEKMAAELDYTLFPKKGPDGGTEESHILLRFPYIRKFSNSNYEWKAGLGIHQLTIKGKDGSAVLNNGSGTATFYFPDHSTTINQFFLEGGFNYLINKCNFSTSFLMESPLNSKSRTLSLLFGLSYQIGSL